MTEIVSKNHKEICRSWVIYAKSQSELFRIQKEIDNIFSIYSFYPEVDWDDYGYRPPDGHQILGAWRHPNTKAFVFLLDNPYMITIDPNIQLILYIVGDIGTIIEEKINRLKNYFILEDKKDRADLYIGNRLDRIDKSKQFKILGVILGLFTAAINGYSHYLRSIPPPSQLTSDWLIIIYNKLIILVHLSSIILLFIFISLLIIFMVKYGVMLIKRL